MFVESGSVHFRRTPTKKSVYFDDNPLIRLQAESAIVAHFANKVKRLTSGVGWNADVDDALSSIFKGEFCGSYLGLLPPLELNIVAVRILRFRGIQTNGRPHLGH